MYFLGILIILFLFLFIAEQFCEYVNFVRYLFSTDGQEFKSKLIGSVKKEVKQIMEEAVTKKFVHEESGSVTSLCAAVEACLSQGLRRRALGLFKTSSTTALLHKVLETPPYITLVNIICVRRWRSIVRKLR